MGVMAAGWYAVERESQQHRPEKRAWKTWIVKIN